MPGWVRGMVRDPRGAVYGTITIGAVLAAESASHETYARTIGAVVATMILFWLAHSYAELTGEQLESGARLTGSRLLGAMRAEISILLGAVIPLMAVVIEWLAGASLVTAVNLAVWVSAATIPCIEFAAARRARLTGTPLLVQTLAGTVFGLGIIVLHQLLH